MQPPARFPTNNQGFVSNPAFTQRVSEEYYRLSLSSSDLDNDQWDGVPKAPPRGTKGKRLKSAKTTKLTSQVIAPQLWPHSQISLAYVSKEKGYDKLTCWITCLLVIVFLFKIRDLCKTLDLVFKTLDTIFMILALWKVVRSVSPHISLSIYTFILPRQASTTFKELV